MTAKIGAKIVNLTFCPIVLSTFNTKKVPIKTYLREKVGFLHSFNENIYYFCKQCSGLPLAFVRIVLHGILNGDDGRKVRAAQGTPLPKIEAVGDSRCRQKRMTARKGKGEKVV